MAVTKLSDYLSEESRSLIRNVVVDTAIGDDAWNRDIIGVLANIQTIMIALAPFYSGFDYLNKIFNKKKVLLAFNNDSGDEENECHLAHHFFSADEEWAEDLAIECAYANATPSFQLLLRIDVRSGDVADEEIAVRTMSDSHQLIWSANKVPEERARWTEELLHHSYG